MKDYKIDTSQYHKDNQVQWCPLSIKGRMKERHKWNELEIENAPKTKAKPCMFEFKSRREKD